MALTSRFLSDWLAIMIVGCSLGIVLWLIAFGVMIRVYTPKLRLHQPELPSVNFYIDRAARREKRERDQDSDSDESG